MKTYDSLIRVSKMNGRKESAETTMTTDDQAATIARAIKEAGGRRGQTFEALDQSGFTIHEGDVYSTILARVRAGKSHGLAVAYGDRLTRNWRAVGAFYDALEAAGAEVIIAGMPGVDYRTMAGRTMTGLMAVMADAGYMTAKARGDAIAELTIARGVPNRVPFGYRRNAGAAGAKTDPQRDAKALVPDEQAAPIVRRIFAMRLDGHRIPSIVRALDNAGVPSPKGGLWTDSTVETIVKNETYTGVVKLGKRRVEAAHEPLVAKADWRRVQGTRAVTHSGVYRVGIAGGLVECSGCGRPLSVAGRTDVLTYSCRRLSTEGRCPRPVHVSKRAADEFVEQALRAAVSLGGGVHVVASARELEGLRADVERARSEREAFVKLASALDPGDFRLGYEERKTREAEAEAAYDDKLAEAADAEAFPASESAYDALDLAHRRRFASRVIDRVVVAPPASRSPRADIGARFELRWRGAGQEAGAGR